MRCIAVIVMYLNESSWPGGFCKKGGKRQSPINIQTRRVVTDFEQQFIRHGSLNFVGYENVLLSGVNNGYTIQFSTEGDKDMHPLITGGPLQHTYRLEQLHFHWLSEHSVDGVKYPMEIHFVHVRADLKVPEALSKRDGLAIVSVFCDVKTHLSHGQQEVTEDIMEFIPLLYPMEIHFVHVRADLKVPEALSKRDGLAIVSVFCDVKTHLSHGQQEVTEDIMEFIPLLLRTGDVISGVLLDLRKLLSPNKSSYFTYLGSLTSPDCNEVVVWIIFEKPIFISDVHYRLFNQIGVGRHNFRSLQKMNHHMVFQPPGAFFTTPSGILVMGDVVKRVSDFFKKITKFVARGFKLSS